MNLASLSRCPVALLVGRLVLACATLALLSACTSIRWVGVTFALDVQVEGRDESGRVWRARPDEITTVPPAAESSTPFARVLYRGPVFRWEFGAGATASNRGGGFGGVISSQLASPVCFRFDQARLSSNWQKQPVPMLVFYAVHQPYFETIKAIKTRELPFQPSPVCFSSQQQDLFNFSPDLSALFPSARMFNVIVPDYQTALPESGKGNWLKIHVPIEYEGKREEIEVTLTVVDSQARVQYSFF